jgi:hypothetical protein
MLPWLLARAMHFYAIAVRQLWQLFFVVIFGTLAGLVTWRDELLSPDSARHYRVLAMIPHWDWGWWVLVVAAFVIAVMVDGSYRITSELNRRVEELSIKPSSDLTVAVTEGMGLCAETDQAPLRPTKTIMVRVKNVGNKLICGCQVAIIDGLTPYFVTTPFDLKIGEHMDFPIIHIPLSMPEQPEIRSLFKGETRSSYACILDEGNYEIKVLSADSYPCSMDVTMKKDSMTWILTQCAL